MQNYIIKMFQGFVTNFVFQYYKLDFEMFGYESPLNYIKMGYDELSSTEKYEVNQA